MLKTQLIRHIDSSDDSEVVLEELWVTESALERMKGLLGSDPLEQEQGLLIKPCNSIHTFFMGYPLDVAFLDKQNRVCHIAENLRAWRCSASFKAASVIEMAAGSIHKKQINLGDQLLWQGG